MPAEKTHADALRFYLTGAGSDGGAQADPDASIGDYRSSTEAEQLGVTVTNPISNVTVDFVGGANGVGAGSLSAESTTTLAWTPPGGTKGTAVTIANGETKILEGGTTVSKFIRVSRTSADNLTGTATVTMADQFNNAGGFDNVSSAEAAAGDDEYRCLCLKNEDSSQVQVIKVWLKTLGTQMTTSTQDLAASGAGSLEGSADDFADWPDTGYAHIKDSGGSTREVVYYSSRTDDVLTIPAAGRGMLGTTPAAGTATDTADAVPGIAIAKEAPSSQPSGNFDDPADEDTAPGGVSWSLGLSSTTGLDIGTLAAGNIYGLWLWRESPVGVVAEASILHHLALSFDAA